MKTFFSFLLIFTTWSVQAQVYFTTANFPNLNTAALTVTCDTTGVPVPSPGLGQVFNYTSLVTQSTAYSYYVHPDSLWCESLFPAATVGSMKYNAHWFYSEQGDTLFFLGNCLADSTSTGSYNAFYYKKAKELFTSMAYNTEYKDSAYFDYYSGAYRKQLTTFRVIADGVLNLPAVTYNNAFVLRRETYIKDPSGTEYEHYLTYQFFDSLESLPVMEIRYFGYMGDSLANKRVTYTDIGMIGVNENENRNEFSVYPNPFTKDFWLEGDAENICIYDLQLKPVLYTVTPENGRIRICLNAKQGIYLLEFRQDDKRLLQKLIKTE